jgi:hypothetical protein
VAQKSYELCDYKTGLNGKNGLCVGGEKSGMACSTNSECQSSGAEVSFAGRCQMFDGTTGRYGLTSSAACGLDCRTPGPYCGDGIVQAEFGEECDGDIQCSVSGLPGSQQCSSSCAIIEQQARAWWKFDDLVVFSVGGKQVGRATEEQGPLLTSAYGGSTLCTIDTSIPSTCPTFVSGGKYGGALQFNGVDSQLHMELQQTSSTQVTYLNQLSGISVEAWIKPTARGKWPRIVEKGGFGASGGYTFQLDSTGEHISFVVWNSGSTASFGVVGNQLIPLNQWTHVVGTFEKKDNLYTLKVYVNGVLDKTEQKTTSEEVIGPSVSSKYIKIGYGTNSSVFSGLLDEVKIYSNVLQDSDVAERAGKIWACISQRASNSPAVSFVSPSCGDGKVGVGEACDRGSENGKTCVPA